MILYYAPGASSLAAHAALREAGLSFEHVAVDPGTSRTAGGADFLRLNPKGCVPALTLDSGETLSENVAILDWIVEQSPGLGLGGPMGRTRLLEALAFIATEVDQAFRPLFVDGGDQARARVVEHLGSRFDLLADMLRGDFLFGNQPTVADSYLFVMLLWARRFDLEVPPSLAALRDRMMGREAVREAMKQEGML